MMKSLITLGPLILVCSFFISPSYGQDFEGWEKLNPTERTGWTKGVTLWFADQFDNPKDEYRFYTALGKELKDELILSTTETARLQNSVFLETSLKLKHNNVKDSQKITNADLKEWAIKRHASYNTTESVNLQSIFIRKFDSESSTTARKRAENALKRIQKGESFGSVAYETSDARSAAINGSAGTITRGKISSDLEKIVFSAPIDKVVGPVESDRGYYLLKVTGKNKTFSLDNDKDKKKAQADLLTFNVNQEMASLGETWREKNNPVVLEEPANKQDWLNQPWIKYGDGKIVPFFHLYFRLSLMDINLASPGEWSDFYREEASIASSDVILALAASESQIESDKAKSIVPIALPAYVAMEKLRSWYAKQKPTDSELKSFFETQKSKLPPTYIYDFVAWYNPVDLATTNGKALSNEEIAERYTQQLNRIDNEISTASKENREDVAKLFGKLRQSFTGSRVTSDTKVRSISPFMDPVLFRTEVNKLSKPFDAGKEIAVIYLLDKKKTEIPLDEVKGSLIESWRQTKLNDFVKSIKKAVGIKK